MDNKKPVPLSNAETASFCAQMAMILKSGISSLEGITIMMENAGELHEKKALSQICNTMLATGNLHQSLTDAGIFPDYMLNMVQIGEQTGKLDDVMDALSDYYQKEADLMQTVRHAVFYPLLMGAMMLLVIFLLLTKVMPVFHQVFKQLGSEMTGISGVLLQAGMFFNRHALLLLVILAVFALLPFLLSKTSAGAKALQLATRKLAFTRELADAISAFRFSNGMALTLSAGMTPEEALKQTIALTDSEPFQRRLESCYLAVSEGGDLCQSLLEKGIFTGLSARMAVIGSRTGVLDEVMHTIAKQYETDIDARFAGIISKIEPTIVIVLSLLVGAILLSVMLPLLHTLSAM